MTNIIMFYNEMTHQVDERKAVAVIYLDFSKGFDTVSCKILIDNLLKQLAGLDRQTRRYLESCRKRQASRR